MMSLINKILSSYLTILYTKQCLYYLTMNNEETDKNELFYKA